MTDDKRMVDELRGLIESASYCVTGKDWNLARSLQANDARIRLADWKAYLPALLDALAQPTPTAAIPAGMVAWAGGDSAPKDWDGGPVLCRGGHEWTPGKNGEQPEHDPAWHRARGSENANDDIIAYTPTAAPRTLVPESADKTPRRNASPFPPTAAPLADEARDYLGRLRGFSPFRDDDEQRLMNEAADLIERLLAAPVQEQAG